jgi:hypothetical protein
VDAHSLTLNSRFAVCFGTIEPGFYGLARPGVGEAAFQLATSLP